MSRFQLLNKPPTANTSVSIAKLRQQIKTYGVLAQLPQLANVALTKEGYDLAEEIKRHLTACLAAQQLPDGFPMTGELKRSYQKQSAAWLHLARVYVAWLQAAEEKLAGQLLADALFCLRQVIVIAGICHWPLPKGLWLDIHRLYLAGRKRQVAQRTSPMGRSDRAARVEKAYIHLLMLGLVDLAGLRPVEVRWLDGLLEKWVPLVKLVEDVEVGWVIDGRADQAARWSGGKPGLRLDFSRLIALLDDHGGLTSQAGRFQPDLSCQTIDLELLQLWRRKWESGTSLPDGRTWTKRAELIFGFAGIFQRLRGGSAPGLPVEATNEWIRILGESVQVGDLTGLFEPGGSRLQALAVVDRLSASGLEGAGISLQLRTLANRVCAVGLQPLHGQFQTYQPALLLEGNGKLHLILQLQSLSEGAILRLLHGSSVYPIRLGRRHHPALGVLSFTCHSAA